MNDIPWVVLEIDAALAEKLAREAGVPEIIARLLVNRGMRSVEDVARFMNPSLKDLHDPFLLPDLEVGVDRLAAALRSGEKICIHGDYDVDGVTSTALLVRTLSALNANVDYKLPHRQRDGYGIKPEAVDAIATSGCSLIVTCDCGISACDTVARASELGIDVIVTDHHEPGPQLPKAIAVIDPKRKDATYPFTGLAGVGVAFKFAQGLVRKLGHNEEQFAARFMDLVALGTVGDVVPLLGENRAIVWHGLDAILSTKKIGLQALMKSAHFEAKALTAYHLAYVLGPRINAAGRMDDASVALRLFITKDENEARELALEMERYNIDRKVEQERILAEAIEQAEAKNLSQARVLVLSNDGWNSGVIGIAASRICEIFGRPAILISTNRETGMGGGSARSVGAFDMLGGLRACAELLTTFGGHALAAGLTLPIRSIEEFEERINAHAAQIIAVEELAPRIEVEAELSPKEITRELADALACMEPFGEGNPEPLFMSRGLTVVSRQRVGDGSHLKLTVKSDGAAPISCIAFKMGDVADHLELGGNIDLCYNIRLNTFNGNESVQLIGKAIR